MVLAIVCGCLCRCCFRCPQRGGTRNARAVRGQAGGGTCTTLIFGIYASEWSKHTIIPAPVSFDAFKSFGGQCLYFQSLPGLVRQVKDCFISQKRSTCLMRICSRKHSRF